jgi:type IX secretion system PorP/SprF family membrane protein
MFNDFAINPAVAGTQKFNRAQLNNRYQFVGIENAPITASLSVFGGSASSPMGWGAMVYNDSQAAISKFGAYAAYAYHISIQKGLDLSFGLNAGLIQYTVDLTKIKFLEEEPYLDATKYNYIRPDGTIGAYLYSKDYYAGVSADQLFNNKLEMISDTIVVDNATLNRLKSHIIITGGYKYKLSYGFELEPNVVIRKTPKSPFQIEATARVGYKKAAWAGLSVRSNAYAINFQADPNDPLKMQAVQLSLFRFVPAITYNFRF